MKKLAELQTAEFVDLLASDAPAPGGGSAAALEGAPSSAAAEPPPGAGASEASRSTNSAVCSSANFFM